jgi:D-alanyl-lipoteichoic acid acyltransferase DltB (MBOAT superfamily)
MVFNSLLFVVLFPFIALSSWILSLRYRKWLLLFFSYYFYMCWEPVFAFLLVFTSAVDFYAAQLIHKSASPKNRGLLLATSVTLNLTVLFFFKYLYFFGTTVNVLAGAHFDIAFKFILPIGISFYTFQSMSYAIDIYRNRMEPEKDFFMYALFVSFFPQLVAGPIERAVDLLPQLNRRPALLPAQLESGLRLMLTGYFRKIVVADQLAPFVESVFDNKMGHGTFSVLAASYFFAFQIYCDFAGYSEIAVGCAQIMGFNLTKNFRAPYFSQSIKDFWRRWHVTLSSWFKDYLYVPLGGNQSGPVKWTFTVLVVFTLSGLWHGANWTYVFWGFFNGLLLVSEKAIGELFLHRDTPVRTQNSGWKKAWRAVLTFHAILIGWIFFRAPTMSDALSKIKKLLTWTTEPRAFSPEIFLLPTAAILSIVLIDLFQHRTTAVLNKTLPSSILRWSVYVVMLWCIFFATASHYESRHPFIYFAF